MVAVARGGGFNFCDEAARGGRSTGGAAGGATTPVDEAGLQQQELDSELVVGSSRP